MDPELYRRSGELFERLQALPADDAAQALETAAAADPALRAAVLRLLEADRRAEDGAFLAGRAIEDAAAVLRPEPSSMAPNGTLLGMVLGAYRLDRHIGTGGMGVVYEAFDLRLQRRVAVKLLPPQTAGETAEGIQRFQQEAQAASLLNHPHIVAIYDAGFEHGHYFIAMEFVEGKTVRQQLAEEPRGLDGKTIVDWLSQAASALSAAHAAGIVHRDIKPDNLMIRPDGFLKVLDFGLAKLRHASGDALAVSALQTRPGQVAGTVHYLSPEQVAGKRVDGRSDLFSLGVVAYELATGQRPFDGPTDGAVFDAILNQQPPRPSTVRPSVRSELDTLVMQCLEKDPELRVQTASDLRSGCKRISRESSQPELFAGVVPRRARRRLWAALAAAAMFVLGAGAALLFTRLSLPSAEASRPEFFERLTDGPGEEAWPSVSADGKQFVYSSARSGRWSIYLQRTGGNTPVELTRESWSDDVQPAFSPDGSRIAFRSERDGGGLFLMEATGENPRRLTRKGYLPTWAPDSRRVAFSQQTFSVPTARDGPGNGLYVVDTVDGSERTLPTADAIQPNWSPHGHRIAYWGISHGGQRDLHTIAASGKEAPIPVTQDAALDWNPVWSPSGRYLYFLSDRGGPANVWRVPIDERTGRTVGPPEPRTVAAHHVGSMSFSGDGRTLVFSQASQRFQPSKVAFDFERRAIRDTPAPVADGGHTVVNFSFSPNGSQVVFDTLGDTGPENLWIMKADGSGRRRVTTGNFRDRTPAWSPTGEEILFFSNRTGSYEAWLIRPDGSGLRRLTALSKPSMQKSIWFPDGRRILASRNGGPPVVLDPRAEELVADPVGAEGLESVNVKFGSVLFSHWFGALAIGARNEPGGRDIVLYGGSPPRLELTGVRGTRANWVRDSANSDNRYFIVARGGQCLLYDRTLRSETLLFSVAPNQIEDLETPPGGGSIYFSQRIRDSDLWRARLEK